MSRLGPWIPADDHERLDRLESLACIRQLPHRYGLAVDSRDLDALVDLFVPDVRVTKTVSGRPALKEWFRHTLSHSRSTIHFVGNHVVDFADADHARGVVYCRDELEIPDSGEWHVGTIQYWDDYVRSDGIWYFQRRKFNRWYVVDALTRPFHGAGVAESGRALATGLLPDVYPTWAEFWDSVEAGPAEAG